MAFIEKLQEYLKNEGYLPELTEFGLQFKSENLDFLSFKDDQDELFLNLFFPQIFEVTQENHQDVLVAIDRANSEVKVAKGSVRFGNAVWVGVEMLLSENFDLNDIVPRSINMMKYYRDIFYQAFSETPSGKLAIEAAQKQQAGK